MRKKHSFLSEAELDRLDEKKIRDSEDFKIESEVFDRSTLLNLYTLSNKGYIDAIYGAISTGKEANVFRAVDREGKTLAVKIFRTATTEFRTMWKYIRGDPRFGKIKKDRRSLVREWAKKEYKNLTIAKSAGVRVPTPIILLDNVLIMEFISDQTGTKPAPTMKMCPPENPSKASKHLIESLAKLYQRAKLVHADFSEYNVLNGHDLVLIDFAQAVLRSHPSSEEFLRRDLMNLLRYFKSLGVEHNYDEVYRRVTGRTPWSSSWSL